MPVSSPASREKFIRAAMQLMRVHGYTATSVDRICQAAGLAKGSFFHYFSSKEELGRAALERQCDDTISVVRSARQGNGAGPMAGLRALIDAMIGRYRDPTAQGCLIGILSQELSGPHDDMRMLCDSAFRRLAREVEALLEEAQAAAAPDRRYDSASLAQYFVVVLEGALVVARAKGDVAPFRDAFEHYVRYVEALLTPAS